jgi:hypothetical protein
MAMKKNLALIIGVAVGAGVGAFALMKTVPAGGPPSPVWTEVAWPFPIDQWGKGKAFRCTAAGCGAAVDLYLRAKIGSCNCVTGISDDAELDRMTDFDLIGEALPRGAGRQIDVGRMQGRSRSYALSKPAGRTAISIAFNDRCDMVVATAVVPHDRADTIEPGVLSFLNSETVLRWAEVTLGL